MVIRPLRYKAKLTRSERKMLFLNHQRQLTVKYQQHLFKIIVYFPGNALSAHFNDFDSGISYRAQNARLPDLRQICRDARN
ncbi:hypothetical protein D3C72_2384590 [compost metagenome]